MPYLFTQELVNGFPDKVKQKFSGYNLIFGQDIKSFSPNSLNLRSRQITRKDKQNTNDFFKEIVRTCDGKNGNVNDDYSIKALKLAMKKAEFIGTEMQEAAGNMRKHDLLFITKKNYKRTGKISNDNIILNEIQGFILTQIGECSLLPNIPALQIICSGNSNVSKYLMYTYIRAVKHLGLNTGLLELAGSYENTSGFCLYNKFGFREDSTLDHSECFNEGATGNTLAMRANLSDPGYKDLDDVVLGIKDTINLKSSNDTNEPMCNKSIDVGKANSKAQLKYINNRTRNRKYLTELFATDDEFAIKDLLDATDIDYDVLNGDGYTDANYALKELIEKGKIIALNQKQDISKLINKNGDSSSNASSINGSSSNIIKKRNRSGDNSPDENYGYNTKRRRSANNRNDQKELILDAKKRISKVMRTKKRRHTITKKKNDLGYNVKGKRNRSSKISN
jgi:hypothetical protein